MEPASNRRSYSSSLVVEMRTFKQTSHEQEPLKISSHDAHLRILAEGVLQGRHRSRQQASRLSTGYSHFGTNAVDLQETSGWIFRFGSLTDVFAATLITSDGTKQLHSQCMLHPKRHPCARSGIT